MLVINNGTVVTMDDARSVYFGGHVVIDGIGSRPWGPGRGARLLRPLRPLRPRSSMPPG